MENRNEEFDSLPFEWQMRILSERREREVFMKNIGKTTGLIFQKMIKLKELIECDNVEEAAKTCFVEAEAFDEVKPFPGDDGFCKEAAKEFDFLRHQLRNKDRGLKRMQLGAKAILDMSCGYFEEADMKASIGEFEDNEEYKAILEYWINYKKE